MTTQKFFIAKRDGTRIEVSEEVFQKCCDEGIESLSPEERAELEARGAAFRKALEEMRDGPTDDKGA